MNAPSLLDGGIRTFSYATVGRVIFDRGRAAPRLAELFAGDGRRILLVVGADVDAGAIANVIRALDGHRVERVDLASPDGVDAAARVATLAGACGAQAIVAVGGETAIEVAKGTILALAGSPLPLYSVPTELGGAEFTCAVESIDRQRGRRMHRDPALYAKVVLLDAELAAGTPSIAWAASGLRLLDHAVERILSTDHVLLADARLVAGIRLIDAFLAPSALPGPRLIEWRERSLGALWLIQSNAGNVRGGFSHSLSRELRARYGIPLAAGSSVFLPAVLRWCAAAATERYEVLGRAFACSGPSVVGAVIERVEELVSELGLPKRLRDLGVPTADLDPVAAACAADVNVGASPWQPADARDLAAKLRAVW